jgi:cytochrome c2
LEQAGALDVANESADALVGDQVCRLCYACHFLLPNVSDQTRAEDGP